MGDAVDSRKVIDVLPPSVGIEQVCSSFFFSGVVYLPRFHFEVSAFLKRSVANLQKEQQIARSKVALLERSVKLEKERLPNKKIVVSSFYHVPRNCAAHGKGEKI